MVLRVQIVCYENKRAFEPHNAYGVIFQKFDNNEIYKDLNGKPFNCVWLGGKSFFPHKSF